jgi:transcriptional regulator with XRE-family HTH domain
MESTRIFRSDVKFAAMEFSDRLAYALSFADKSRRELADHLGISMQAVSQVLNGVNKNMNAENTIRAARFLKVSSWWLATGEGPPIGRDALCEALSSEAISYAVEWDSMSEPERAQFKLLLAAVRVAPTGHGDLDDNGTGG